MSTVQEIKFVDVKTVTPTNTGAPWHSDMRDTVTIRDHAGRVLDVLYSLPDGNFHGSYGIIRRTDLGEYVLRMTGRMPR